MKIRTKIKAGASCTGLPSYPLEPIYPALPTYPIPTLPGL